VSRRGPIMPAALRALPARSRHPGGRLALALGLALCAVGTPAWAGGPEAGCPGRRLARASAAAVRATTSPPPKVAVLALTLRGIAPDQEKRYHDVLRAELKRGGYEVVEERDTHRILERRGAPPNCTVGPCLQVVGSLVGAERVVVGGGLAQGSNYDINLTFLDTNQGAPVAQALERCEVCTADEGLRAFARVIASLTGRAPSRGARNRPAPRVLWQAEAPWYQRPVWRIGTLALGVSTLAVGATLLALDGSCADGRNCPRTYEFTVSGVTLVGVGALVTAVGVGLFLIKPRVGFASRLSLGVGPKGMLLCGSF
jgi:hypothetical protein